MYKYCVGFEYTNHLLDIKINPQEKLSKSYTTRLNEVITINL
ncbi:MAG: hypothetical protein ACI9FW_000989 [Flavobacterium sp.]|jgi:hypothetical protein